MYVCIYTYIYIYIYIYIIFAAPQKGDPKRGIRPEEPTPKGQVVYVTLKGPSFPVAHPAFQALLSQGLSEYGQECYDR